MSSNKNDNNNNSSNFEQFVRRDKIGRGLSNTVEKSPEINLPQNKEDKI